MKSNLSRNNLNIKSHSNYFPPQCKQFSRSYFLIKKIVIVSLLFYFFAMLGNS